MKADVFLYIIVMAVVTYLVRVLPLTLIRKEIKNTFIKSFLYYVPYVTLAVMIFPAIIRCNSFTLVCVSWIHYCHCSILFWWKLV